MTELTCIECGAKYQVKMNNGRSKRCPECQRKQNIKSRQAYAKRRAQGLLSKRMELDYYTTYHSSNRGAAQDSDNPYEALRGAIISQAAYDYVVVIKAIKNQIPRDALYNKARLRELEIFFIESPLVYEDGEILMEEIRKWI